MQLVHSECEVYLGFRLGVKVIDGGWKVGRNGPLSDGKGCQERVIVGKAGDEYANQSVGRQRSREFDRKEVLREGAGAVGV
jgi:hypothetical protein